MKLFPVPRLLHQPSQYLAILMNFINNRIIIFTRRLGNWFCEIRYDESQVEEVTSLEPSTLQSQDQARSHLSTQTLRSSYHCTIRTEQSTALSDRYICTCTVILSSLQDRIN